MDDLGVTLGALRGDGRDGWRMVVASKVGGRGLLSGYLVVTWWLLGGLEGWLEELVLAKWEGEGY